MPTKTKKLPYWRTIYNLENTANLIQVKIEKGTNWKDVRLFVARQMGVRPKQVTLKSNANNIDIHTDTIAQYEGQRIYAEINRV